MLPTGIVHYNTTNIDIVVGSTQEGLEIKIIWPHNMMDVMTLLSQFSNGWHGYDIIMWKKLALENALTNCGMRPQIWFGQM